MNGAGGINGNGASEMVWRNNPRGAEAVWFMNGGAIGSLGFPAVVQLKRQNVQVGDANGDGKANYAFRYFENLSVLFMKILHFHFRREN